MPRQGGVHPFSCLYESLVFNLDSARVIKFRCFALTSVTTDAISLGLSTTASKDRLRDSGKLRTVVRLE